MAGCAGLQPSENRNAQTAQPRWHVETLSGSSHERSLEALYRGAIYQPTRARIWVIPGSGCSGMGPLASRYFAGLLHAEVIVLHKHGVSALGSKAASDCSPAFVRDDAPKAWLDDLIKAVGKGQQRDFHDETPQWLVGISEGGELAPHLAPYIRNLHGIVLIGSAGLDPASVASLRLSDPRLMEMWAEVVKATQGTASNTTIIHGRSLRYWRDFLDWRTADILHGGAWTLLQAWGTRDEMVPKAAYDEFARLQTTRVASYCPVEIVGADHNLQQPDGTDGIQRIWSILEGWIRNEVLRCPRAEE